MNLVGLKRNAFTMEAESFQLSQNSNVRVADVAGKDIRTPHFHEGSGRIADTAGVSGAVAMATARLRKTTADHVANTEDHNVQPGLIGPEVVFVGAAGLD